MSPRKKCAATASSGTQCKKYALDKTDFCKVHLKKRAEATTKKDRSGITFGISTAHLKDVEYTKEILGVPIAGEGKPGDPFRPKYDPVHYGVKVYQVGHHFDIGNDRFKLVVHHRGEFEKEKFMANPGVYEILKPKKVMRPQLPK